MAVKAAARHGVPATARRLGLNATRLKQWAQRLSPVEDEEDPRFVELPWLGAASIPECLLEAEEQSGRKLRIHLKGPAAAQAASLSRLLWTNKE